MTSVRSPTPTIRWYRKGAELPENKVKLENFNKTLLVVGVSEEDAGEYVCMATNHLGGVRHSILVQVKGQHAPKHQSVKASKRQR